MLTATRTTRERFTAAVDAAQDNGLHVRLNVMTCCRSCTDWQHLGLTKDAKGAPLAWHFGGQDNELAWDEDGAPFYLDEDEADVCSCTEDEYDEDEDGDEVLVYEGGECSNCAYGPGPRRRTPARDIYFQFEPDVSVGQRLRDAFEGQGFTVDWDGTMASTVAVDFGGTHAWHSQREVDAEQAPSRR